MKVPELIQFSWWQRWSRTGARVQAALRLEQWFPHVPMALAVGLLGALSVLETLPSLAKVFPELQVITPSTSLTQVPLLSALGTVPELVAGIVLLIMAFGLLFRSRFSWVITLLLAAVTLALLVHQFGWTWNGMMVFNVAILLALLIFRNHFARSSVAAGSLFAVVSVLLLMSYAVFGAYVLGAGFSPKINNLVTALYFSVVTMSTVGYGDIVPKSEDARLFVVSIILLGITVFATSISAVIVPLVSGRMQRLLLGEKKSRRRNHYLLVGDNALAQNTYRALRERHLPVLVLLPHRPENLWMEEADLMIGDPADPEVLRQAGALQALGVLALRSDDSENAFIVLAAKDLGIDGKTVAAVDEVRNLARLRKTGVDLVIAPQVLGGRVLIQSLSGQSFAGEEILSGMFGEEARA